MSNCIIPGGSAGARVSSFRDAVEAIGPALDSVELWLTPTIEQDFEQRGAFPELRGSNAVATRSASGWGLHFLRPEMADIVLADGVHRTAEVAGGMTNAYHGHERRLREAINDARERPALFGAERPRRKKAWGDVERWIGTSEQFRSMGISAFPGEAGSSSRSKLKTKDSRGFSAHVCRSTNLWAGLFEVTISLPPREKEKHPTAPSGPSLDTLPNTPAELRKRLEDAFLHVIVLSTRAMKSQLGYRFSDESIDSFRDALAEAHDVLKTGDIVGRSRDQEIQRAAAARAKEDSHLQRFLLLVKNAPPLDDEESP